jgi:hypothetical protein
MRETCLVVFVGALLAVPAATVVAGKPEVQPTRGPVKIHVAPKAAPAPLSAEEVKAREAKARQGAAALEELEKATKKQFGKDMGKWPAEQRVAFHEAVLVNNMAWEDAWYAVPSEKDKSDSAENVRDALSGFVKKGWFVLVDQPAEADLVLEIVGRRGMGKMMRGAKLVSCELRPGKIGGEVLARIPPAWPSTFSSRAFTNLRADHWFKVEAPFFRFEVSDVERWKDVAGKVPWVLTDFVRDNYDLLKPAP